MDEQHVAAMTWARHVSCVVLHGVILVFILYAASAYIVCKLSTAVAAGVNYFCLSNVEGGAALLQLGVEAPPG
jgi:hypothetical protein